MDKEKEEILKWIESQKIEISVDLSAAAKQHLLFLGAVDRNRWLYDGPALQRAIYRSKSIFSFCFLLCSFASYKYVDFCFTDTMLIGFPCLPNTLSLLQYVKDH